MSVRLSDLYRKDIVPSIKEKFKFSSVMQVPKLDKIVLSIGAGSFFNDTAKMEHAMSALSYIAGQKACFTKAKKSIAGFKVREGMKTGLFVTLRKDKMYEFLDRFRNISLPRMRDFRGLNESAINGRAFSFGIKDYAIFPEVRDLLKNTENIGLNITFVTNKNDKKAFKALLIGFGLPFKEKEN